MSFLEGEELQKYWAKSKDTDPAKTWAPGAGSHSPSRGSCEMLSQSCVSRTVPCKLTSAPCWSLSFKSLLSLQGPTFLGLVFNACVCSL